MKVIHFIYKGRFAHFLKAEASTSAISYPVPPRTVLLGLAGAILGLEKDSPQTVLSSAFFALRGKVPRSHWHKANFRKDPPAPLDHKIKASSKGSCSEEENTRINQEWLFNPRYEVWASLPSPFHDEFSGRLRERKWHFCPCMGLSEMMADLEYQGESEAEPMPPGVYPVSGIVREDTGKIDVSRSAQEGLHLKLMRIPCFVTPDRVFQHASYWLEKNDTSIPFRTDCAWKTGNQFVVFM